MDICNIYRDWIKAKDLVKNIISYKDTNMCILAQRNLEKKGLEVVRKYYGHIEDYLKKDLEFKDSLKPLERKGVFPSIIKQMLDAGRKAGVGPMAAVAGAVAEFVGKDLLVLSDEIIVENGGDIFIKSLKNRKFGVFAGKSPLTGKLTFEIMADDTPLGVCTSSGTVGHSLSFGSADAVCIISKNTALADAVATATGNMIKGPCDIRRGISFAKSISGIMGGIIIIGEKFGVWGRLKLST